MRLADIIVFVDDDDYISKESLSLCVAAMADNDVGLAYTRERVLRNDGFHCLNYLCRNYEDIYRSPSAIHHMAAVRSSAVTERSLALAAKWGCGIEWIMKAEAALTQGAIHIPHTGYFYVQHPGQVSHVVGKQFTKAIKPIGDAFRSWRGHSARNTAI